MISTRKKYRSTDIEHEIPETYLVVHFQFEMTPGSS